MGNAARKSLVLAKIEGTYGTDPTPTVAANAVLAGKVDYSVAGKSLERDAYLSTFGRMLPVNVGETINLSFSVEARASGTAATPPRWGCLVRACNFTETVAANVIYAPNSTMDGSSVTIYFYADGILHKACGCVGTFKVQLKSGEYGKLLFDMKGIYSGSASSDSSPGAPTYGDAATVPRFVSAAFAFQTVSLAIDNLEFDVGNSIGLRRSANAASGITRLFINDRAVKGSFDPAVDALSTFNPWTKWDTSATGAITAALGSGAGNTLTFASPNCSLTDPPKYGEREGERTYALGFACGPTLSAGDNEFTITHA